MGIGDDLLVQSILPLLDTLQPMPLKQTLPGSIPPSPILVSLTDSALTLLASFLAVSFDTQEIRVDAAGYQDESTVLGPLLERTTNRCRPVQAAAGSGIAGEGETGESADADSDPSTKVPARWVRLLVDLDEALEHSRRASHDQVFADDDPATPAQRMPSGIEVLLDDWWPTVRHPGSLARGSPPIRERVVRAIDEAIRPWRPEAPHLPQTAPPVVVEPTSAAPVIEETADPARPPGGSTPSSPEGGLARTEQVSVSLVLAAALLAYRVAHHRRRPADHRQEGPVRGP